LPEYESSSDEENEEENNHLRPHMTTQDYEQSMKYIENFYNKCSTNAGGVPMHTRGSDNLGGETPEDYVMCQINNGSSILVFEKEESQRLPSQFNPGSLMDEDFCYSIDKNSKRRRSSS